MIEDGEDTGCGSSITADELYLNVKTRYNLYKLSMQEDMRDGMWLATRAGDHGDMERDTGQKFECSGLHNIQVRLGPTTRE